MWTHGCKYFHDPDDFSDTDLIDWFGIVLRKIKDEFRLRLYESHTAIQWLHIVAERRVHSLEKDPDAPLSAKAPERRVSFNI